MWNDYLRSIYRLGVEIPGQKTLFPNIGLCTETKNFFIFELFGTNERFDHLIIKEHKEPSHIKYLHQFNSSESSVSSSVISGRVILKGALFARKPDYKILENRFGTNFRSNFPQAITCTSGSGSSVTFKDLASCAMDNCLIINRYDNFFRIKSIIFLIIISKKISKQEYKKILLSMFYERAIETNNSVYGISFAKGQLGRGYALANQFSNIFLLPGLRETTIGEFIRNNPMLIRQAFHDY